MNKIIKIPKNRNEFDFEFNKTPYIKRLNQIEKNLNNLNIQFNTLYKNAGLSKNAKHIEFYTTKDNKQHFIFEPEIYNNIINEIREIGNFVKNELEEQKLFLSNKLYSKLIDLNEKNENYVFNKLMEQQDILCLIHQLMDDMNHLINSYNFVKQKINQMNIDKISMKKEIYLENKKTNILKNNICYYKERTRDLILKIEQINKEIEENEKNNINSNKKNKNIFFNYKNTHFKNHNKKKSFYNSNQYVITTTNTNSDFFTSSYEQMTKTLRNFNNKTFFITNKQKNTNFLLNNFNNVSEKEQSLRKKRQKLNNLISYYIEKTKIKFNKINENYYKLYKSEKSVLFDYTEEKAFRNLFMEKILKDPFINEIYDKHQIKTIMNTIKVINNNNY